MDIPNHTGMELVAVSALKPFPKNRNKHPESQIKRLAKIIEYQGWRYPVKVSKRTGYITSGHGRLDAARLLGVAAVPVSYQDYESEEQEYADMVSDNAIASWAELDLSGINEDLPDLGPDLDIDLLGLEDFKVDVAELPDLQIGDRGDLQQMTFTLSEDQVNQVKLAIEKASGMGEYVDGINENKNGNALARVCEIFNGDR